MTTNKEMERIVRSWLEPGLTTLTDDVLDPVLDQLPATPQRRPVCPPRRIADTSWSILSGSGDPIRQVAAVTADLERRERERHPVPPPTR